MMRADRLLSILMLLQARGKMTALQLAGLLEVSERTIYRDMLALNSAGVPVFSESGHRGGFCLLESYRTTLTGLSAGETQALFMLSVPEVFTDLGINTDLKAALRKLAAALPDRLRADELHVRERFLLDSTWWQDDTGTVPHLKKIHQAVWTNRVLKITYIAIGSLNIDLVVRPYALVSKAGRWYMVCESVGRMRVFAVSDLVGAELQDAEFERRLDFILEEFWKDWCSRRQAVRKPFKARVLVASPLKPFLPGIFGTSYTVVPSLTAESGDEIVIEVWFESQIDARNRILALGIAVEVLEPESLRWSVGDVADQVALRYRRAQ